MRFGGGLCVSPYQPGQERCTLGTDSAFLLTSLVRGDAVLG
ncbi:hypothetical protein BIFGAL_03005 [Bifidobacterium gallicum DSM 20093 = LMG 11596]|uniref:Uncharacterized protein n=1 Tax=Bifidobacterium gallicum DSM 20093 = LMG 11596 TaxID=561180 RepID=D1NRQ6_9BIFI|nr:hypothetical protein BIFGAL_03005 [Bifidobacterium gallicum DSM 20093 = LMG 11596]